MRAATKALAGAGVDVGAPVRPGGSLPARGRGDGLRGLRGRVLYPGLAPNFSPGPGPGGEPYVFHLAWSDPRDNTETVLRAVAQVRQRTPIRLVVGGAAPRVGADAVYT